jgi:DegV family protein with EDD domain
MRKVAIVTDSTATVPKDLVQALDIHVVPVPLLYGSKTFRDGPTTTTPSVGDFVRVYAAAAQGASGVLSVHMSPDLSTTHGVAVMASQLVDGVPIRVFNCDTAAMGQGFVVLEAARAAARGASLDEVLKRAKEVAAKTHLLFTLDTFEYLHRGGRIGGAASLLGTALQIKPVLYLDGGRIEVMAKPRTKPKAIRLILQRIAEQAEGRRLHAAIIHADVPQEAEELRKTVAERFNCAELYVTEFTPVMGAHTGPGILGVAFYAE